MPPRRSGMHNHVSVYPFINALCPVLFSLLISQVMPYTGHNLSTNVQHLLILKDILINLTISIYHSSNLTNSKYHSSNLTSSIYHSSNPTYSIYDSSNPTNFIYHSFNPLTPRRTLVAPFTKISILF